jgi:dTDP-4-dehydrorhamnose reductase
MIGSYIDFGMRTNRRELDVMDGESVMRFVKEHMPRAIIHLAAATDMDHCERDPLYAYELNVRGTYNIARAAREVDAVLVYASSSRVFKGDSPVPYAEHDAPNPETHYGRTKHIGECIAMALAPHCIIARTSWVFGGGPERDNKFYGTVLKQLESGISEIIALNDVHGSPTYGKDYIAAIQAFLAAGERGIFHIANAGVATRFDLARAIAAQVKPGVTVRAVDRSHFASAAALPNNESIVSSRPMMRPWQDALTEYVADEWETHLRHATIIP